jgi:surface protein
MFYNCTSLTSVPLFNTGAVTDMGFMFYNCTSLTSVPLFNTGAVTDMGFMFNSCTSLTSVPLFNTGAVTAIGGMFNSCTSLTSVPLFNTGAVTDMGFMFNSCTSLTSVPLFNTGAVTDMSNMFYNCTSLTTVPLFNTGAVTNMSGMFNSCTSLTSVPLFNTGAVTNMSFMFNSCTTLTTVPLLISGAGTTTTKFNNIFSSCISLTRAALNGSKYSISYSGCKLSKEELESIFNYLDTIAPASQTITVTNNWGAPTPVTLTGTTTAGSTTITMANTTNIAVGMQITGTGSPLTSTRAVTFTDAGDLVNLASHGLSNGDEVSFATRVTTTGIVTNRIYYVVNAASNTFQVAATLGGSALTLTTNGTGTLRYRTQVVSINPNVSIVVSRPMTTSASNTLTFRQLRTGTALLKGWAVTA